MKILSIDGWNTAEGWEWNQWYTVGDISKEEFERLDTDEKILDWFFGKEYIYHKEDCVVYDDEYNIVIESADTGEPLYAIEYGPEY